MGLRSCTAIFLLFATSLFAAPARLTEPSVAALNPNARQVFRSAMDWSDRCWDPHSSLLLDAPGGRPTVRESSWYALGLLLRNHAGDRDRAISALNAVLAEQYNAPGMPFNGTFHRNLWEPSARAGAVMWKDYDPNWREFIGTTFAIILEEFPDRIPQDLKIRLNQSIVRAVAGEIANKRLVATYTNPSLMFGFLWGYAAAQNHRADWAHGSAQWQQTVYSLFKQYGAFSEYNSPTYSGVDLYALSLWRRFGPTPRTRAMGAGMEADLWRNLARLYNANLRNVSGPFDRAYGMDMQSYVSVVGLALRMVMSPQAAPFPDQPPPLEHGGDLLFAPHFAVLGVQIPADAMQSFRSFQGPRLVRQQIDAHRVAEAWIGRDVMYGGEITGKTLGISGESQFHPATLQWRMPDGKIGWMELIQAPSIDVSAGRQGLNISCRGNLRLRIHAPGAALPSVKSTEWALPGLGVRVATDAARFSVSSGPEGIDMVYSGVTYMRLVVVPPGRTLPFAVADTRAPSAAAQYVR